MSEIKIGDIFETNKGGSITVIRYTNTKNITVKFNDNYGHNVNTRKDTILAGSIINPYFPSFNGYGYIGVGKYITECNGRKTKEYTIWFSMIRRCYDKNFHIKNPTYKDCSVCDEWLNFQNFSKWYTEHEYYDTNYQLDKDILYSGNKMYSPETCVLIPSQINSLFNDCGTRRGLLPIGVAIKDNRYTTSISFDGKSKRLGYFDTIEEASNAYNKAKLKNVKRVALKYKDTIEYKVYETLMYWTPNNE